MQETTLALKQKQSEQKPEHDVHKRSLAKAEQQIANIMAAIQAGIITPTTKEALIRAEAEHKYAENQLKESSQAVEILTTLLPSAAERYSAIVSNLSQSLYTDVAQARQCLKELMGQIRLVPSANGYLDAELRPTPKDS